MSTAHSPVEAPAAKPAPRRSILKQVLLGALGLFAALVAVVLGLAALKPDEFRVERSQLISAPPEKIFPHVNELRQWKHWSPFEKLDPDMKRTFSGPAAGPGAVYAWDGDDKAGAGEMKILDAEAPRRIHLSLEFIRPFADKCDVEFTFTPQGDQTNVTWAMYGRNHFVGKIMQVFCDMDAMIGGDFEQGLADLQAVAEQ